MPAEAPVDSLIIQRLKHVCSTHGTSRGSRSIGNCAAVPPPPASRCVENAVKEGVKELQVVYSPPLRPHEEGNGSTIKHRSRVFGYVPRPKQVGRVPHRMSSGPDRGRRIVAGSGANRVVRILNLNPDLPVSAIPVRVLRSISNRILGSKFFTDRPEVC
jgi:hypothetical protein